MTSGDFIYERAEQDKTYICGLKPGEWTEIPQEEGEAFFARLGFGLEFGNVASYSDGYFIRRTRREVDNER